MLSKKQKKEGNFIELVARKIAITVQKLQQQEKGESFAKLVARKTVIIITVQAPENRRKEKEVYQQDEPTA
jgi:hypothetical protein